MKNQALPNSQFYIKISGSAEFSYNKHGKPTLHFLTANHVLEMSVKLKFQCIRFEKKHCFALVVLNWFPICFYQSLFTRCNSNNTIPLYFETKEMIYGSVKIIRFDPLAHVKTKALLLPV